MPETIGTMPNQPKTPITAIRIPTELKSRVAAKAAAEGTSLSAVVIKALERYAGKSKN
jgi:predicted HicB family RNase H-like nuclease